MVFTYYNQPHLSTYTFKQNTLPSNTFLHADDMVLFQRTQGCIVQAEFSLLAGGILNSEANYRILEVTFLISQTQVQINFLKVGTAG